MHHSIVQRLRRAADERCFLDSTGKPPWPINHDGCRLLELAADTIDTLMGEVAACIGQRERMIDAMKDAQAKLRELQDYIITPKDDGL